MTRASGTQAIMAWMRAEALRCCGTERRLVMVIATRVMMPIAVMVGIYIFLRGHNQPGGGFVAGLVISIALLMQYMASGFAWTQSRQRIEYHTMIGWGVVIAGLTGAGAWLAGKPFLTSAFGYVRGFIKEHRRREQAAA